MKTLLIALLIVLTSCGKNNINISRNPSYTPPDQIGATGNDYVVKAQAVATLTYNQDGTVAKISNFIMAKSYAANSPLVNYTVAPNVIFNVDFSQLGVTTSVTNDVLNLGNISITALSDNNLKVCGTNGTTKCGTAAIRVYTSAGFLNAADNYTLPYTMQHGTDAPVSLGIGIPATGTGLVQSISIPSTTRRIFLNNFSAPTYTSSIDLLNAGAGGYVVTVVVELVLGA